MATRRKAETDPLIEELPEPTEPRPESADDVKFDIDISPYVVNGAVFYRWDLVSHTHETHIGSYAGHNSPSHMTAEAAEEDARAYVSRIRHTLALKLDLPETVRITL